MKSKNLLLGLAFIALASCNKKEDSNSPTQNPAPQDPPKVEVASNDYKQMANLNLMSTNQELSAESRNTLSIEGVGKKSTYKFVYFFKPVTSGAFKVLQTTLVRDEENCSSSQDVQMYLISDKNTQSVSVVQKFAVEAGVQYKLEVNVPNSECTKRELTLELLAWFGSPRQEPQVGLTCQSYASGTMTIFQGFSLSAYIETLPKPTPYLNNDWFCGEEYYWVASTCKINPNDSQNREPFYTKSATCQSSAPLGEKEKSFSVVFDNKSKTAKLTCKLGEMVTHSDVIGACKSRVVDSNVYSKY